MNAAPRDIIGAVLGMMDTHQRYCVAPLVSTDWYHAAKSPMTRTSYQPSQLVNWRPSLYRPVPLKEDTLATVVSCHLRVLDLSWCASIGDPGVQNLADKW